MGMRDAQNNYRFVVEKIAVEHFTLEEMSKIAVMFGDTDSDELYKGVWYQVVSQKGRTVHIPPKIASVFFAIMAIVVTDRIVSREAKEAAEKANEEQF
jgi:hypothetical protein